VVAGVNTSIARYALGIVALAVIGGALAFAALLVRRCVLPDWTGPPARLAETVVGLALLIGILELLGLVGLFALGPVLVACLLVAVLATRLTPAPSRVRSRTATGSRAAVGLGVGIAILGGATVLAEWGALSIQSYDVGIRGFDSLWYHLPWAASFAQTGNIASLRFTDVEYLTPFYPATAEALHGLGIVLLGRDTLSPGLNLLWLALTLLAAYCIGRPRGVGPATLLGAALALATTMMDYSQAGSAANDVVAIFFLLAAVALVMTAPESRAALVLAALSAGLAIGVKLTVAAPVLALTVGVIAIAPHRRRLAAAGWWLGPLILAGGFWYARNLIAVGNPLPWTSFAGVLSTPAAPLQQDTGYSVAHYVTSTHFWSAFAQPALAAGLGRWWWAVLGVAIIGPLLCLAWPRTDRLTRMLGFTALFSLAAYLITPETAAGPAGDPVGFAFNLRYLGPALALSLAVAPLAPPLSSAPAARIATTIALAVIMAVTVAQPQLWPTTHTAGAIAIGAVAVILVAAAWFAVRRPVGRGPVLATTLLATLALAGAGYALQRHYLRARYVYQPGVSYLAPVWAHFRDVRNARVGVVGTFGGFFAYPLAGLDDSNRVLYIAQRGPDGSFTPIATCAQWRSAVNRAHLDYLLTTPARDPWHPRVLSPSPENDWTASDPAAQPVYRENALGQPIVLYRIRGPLNPATCG
jgi:hypothetical protein